MKQRQEVRWRLGGPVSFLLSSLLHSFSWAPSQPRPAAASPHISHLESARLGGRRTEPTYVSTSASHFKAASQNQRNQQRSRASSSSSSRARDFHTVGLTAFRSTFRSDQPPAPRHAQTAAAAAARPFDVGTPLLSFLPQRSDVTRRSGS